MTLLLRYLLGLIGLGGQPAEGGGGEDPETPETEKRIGGGRVLSLGAARQRIIPFVNKSGEKIPPGAAIKLKHSRAGARNYHKAYKPEKDDDPFVVFNGPTEVEPDEDGFASADYPLWARYNAEDGDPENGEAIGTRAGFWELYRGYEGFLVWGGADGEKVFVQPDVTCRQVGGGYYIDKFISSCCGLLPGMLEIASSSSSAHNGTYSLQYYHASLSDSVPWLPTSGIVDFAQHPGWYSQPIEDFEQTVDVSGSDGIYNHRYEFTDTYYFAFCFRALCNPITIQWRQRAGTHTRTRISDGHVDIFDISYDALLTGWLFSSACYNLSCDPLLGEYWLHNYLSLGEYHFITPPTWSVVFGFLSSSGGTRESLANCTDFVPPMDGTGWKVEIYSMP